MSADVASAPAEVKPVPVESAPVATETIPVPPAGVTAIEKQAAAPVNDNTSNVKAEETKSENEIPVDYVKVQNEGSSLVASIVNMMNTIVGAGVLSIPLTVKKSGIIGAFILLACSL